MAFKEVLTQLTTSTTNLADNFNTVHNELLENDKYIKQQLEDSTTDLQDQMLMRPTQDVLDDEVRALEVKIMAKVENTTFEATKVALETKNTEQDTAIDSKVSTTTFNATKTALETVDTNLQEDINTRVQKTAYATDKAALENAIAAKTTSSLNGLATNVNFIAEDNKIVKVNDMPIKDSELYENVSGIKNTIITKTRNILDVTQLIKDKAISYSGDINNYTRNSTNEFVTPLIRVKQNEIYKSAFKYFGRKAFKYVLFNTDGKRIEFDDSFKLSFVVKQDGWVALSFGNSENIPEAIQLVDSLDDVPDPENTLHHNYKYNPYYHEEKPLDVIDKTGGFTAIFHKIGVIGDSLASGAMEYAGTGVSGMAKDMLEYAWGQSIARATGCEVIQFSKGGAYVHDDNWLTSFKTSVINNPCIAYIIMIGSNDQQFAEANLGTPADITEDYTKNPNTFYGKYAQTIQFIKTIQPKAKIFVCTLPYARIPEYMQTAIRYMATYFTNTYLIDLKMYSKPPTFSYKDINTTGSFHLNTIGYQRVAWEIMSYIDYIVRHNGKAFVDVQFIGTNYELAKDGGDAS